VIHHGDLFTVLPTLDAESVDACVTDPPYGLEFMGKEWDRLTGYFAGADNFKGLNLPRQRRRNVRCPECNRLAYDHKPCECGGIVRHRNGEMQDWHAAWTAQVFRVLKPGAHLVAFGGTRTFHRLTAGIEDAGFEIRDCLSWLYGSGFPKSLNLPGGLGTALKPAWEPIILARKPTRGTVAQNVAQFGTAALNIDACRINFQSEDDRASWVWGGAGKPNTGNSWKNKSEVIEQRETSGRWPANVILDEDAAAMLDQQTGEFGDAALRSGGPPRTVNTHILSGMRRDNAIKNYGDISGASRFYYVAKPSREERDIGCYDLAPQQRDETRKDGNPGGDNPRNRGLQRRGNHHPTVKPVELMRWLVRLVTPPGGTVLDPFTGSGTTGMACAYELRPFIGIEREADYVAIAERRIAAVAPLFGEASA
jgi:DNA modification methylase